jgi:hypothetical protein
LPSPEEVNGLAYLGSSDYNFYAFGLSQDLIRRPFFRQLWVHCAWRTWPDCHGEHPFVMGAHHGVVSVVRICERQRACV